MGIQALQKFIETNCPGACVPVDLLKIARNVVVQRSRGGKKGFQSSKLSLVVDGECCLDRLYGGYFSDWVCGGQWNRMVQFLAVLIQTIQQNNIELAVFFNGSLESQRMSEWIKQQQNERKKINQVLKHINTKGTPPPKVWWSPPMCLTTCLRMALRHLDISVVCTMDDHHQEVIAYCRENFFHGLMGEDSEYAIFDPPRYFSSEQLKLTYKGSLETKEFILNEVARELNLHPDRFCVFAALLGNYLLTEEDLHDFYKTICPDVKIKQLIPSDVLIRAVSAYVRDLPNVDNLDAIASRVFGSENGQNDEKIQKFKQCVQYYLNGTKDGFLRYRPSGNARLHESGHYPPPQRHFNNVTATNPTTQTLTTNIVPNSVDSALGSSTQESSVSQPTPSTEEAHADDSSKFASETVESELSSLTAYQEATGMYSSQTNAPQIVIDPPKQSQVANSGTCVDDQKNDSQSRESYEDGYEEHGTGGAPTTGSYGAWVNGISSQPAIPCSPKNNGNYVAKATVPTTIGQNPQLKLPNIPPEVVRTASERHQKGLMSPWIYQILSQGEIKLPVCVEEETPKDMPNSAILFRPIRQMIYAILFNMHHHHFLAKQKAEQSRGKENIANSSNPSAISTSNASSDVLPHKESGDHLPVTNATSPTATDQGMDISVREWVWSKNNPYNSPDVVKAVPLGWAVPTVQRLWFGSALDDKKRRLRAFLTCMRSDSPLMLNTSYVPQHLLVMCCVLRYIISHNERRILRKQELDAFLVQSVSPHLMDSHFMGQMQLPLIKPRGVQLAALFMRGVETALFANDACGAPVPWLMCCPWLFFDGKLFHQKLLKADTAKSLIDVCDEQIDQVAKVERMRQAILEGLKVEFARPPLPIVPQNRMANFPPPHILQTGLFSVGRGRGRGPLIAGDVARGGPNRRGMLARGGQLEIAGVVVGSWGPNFGTGGGRPGRTPPVAPQVTSVGGVRRGLGTLPSYIGSNRGARQSFGTRRLPFITTKKNPSYGGNKKRVKKQSFNRQTLKQNTPDEGSGFVAHEQSRTPQEESSKQLTGTQPVQPGEELDPENTVALNGQFDDARGEAGVKTVIMKKGHSDPAVPVNKTETENCEEVTVETGSAAIGGINNGDRCPVPEVE